MGIVNNITPKGVVTADGQRLTLQGRLGGIGVDRTGAVNSRSIGVNDRCAPPSSSNDTILASVAGLIPIAVLGSHPPARTFLDPRARNIWVPRTRQEINRKGRVPCYRVSLP